jgi:2-keto-4-pentenoate hydratase
VTEQEHQRVATALADAYGTRSPVEPPSASCAMTLDDAYAIQALQVQRWLAEGATVKGHKVGLTSRAMQKMLGVDQPDYGHLLDTMFLASGERADAGRFLQPRVEPEIAFVLGRDLTGPGVTPVDVLRATDFVVASLELIDSRIRDWKITLVDTIADNASSGAVVLASRPVLPGAVDLRLTGCTLHHNGTLVATGAGGAVLGDPVRAVAWLANVRAATGEALHAGDVVLPGSCTAAVPVSPGDSVRAEFAGIGAVHVSFDWEQGEGAQ